ncbi:MAG: hypothetical protein MZV64_00480 [Ignavibacteriales bacterium]|nr:hypothetical protein [Ignavibacteriales bacterium]
MKPLFIMTSRGDLAASPGRVFSTRRTCQVEKLTYKIKHPADLARRDVLLFVKQYIKGLSAYATCRLRCRPIAYP